jgi:hypothetical protein
MFIPSLRIAEERERVALVARSGDRAGFRIGSDRNRGVAARMATGARSNRIPVSRTGLGAGVLGPSTKSALVSDVLGLGESRSHEWLPTNAANAQVR